MMNQESNESVIQGILENRLVSIIRNQNHPINDQNVKE